MGILHINALGTSFSIQAKESDAYLEELLARYKDLALRIEQGTGLKDNLKIAIMTGISLCDELKQMKLHKSQDVGSINQSEEDLFEAEQIALKLIENIDRALQ